MNNYWKKLKLKYLLMSIFISFIIMCFIAVLPFNSDKCDCSNGDNQVKAVLKYPLQRNFKLTNHKLGILVPFRDRFEELLHFIPHITKFLDKQNVNYHIFILHQVDRYRFNRASLINVGFIYTKRNFDYIAIHDVDLLPINDNLSYHYPHTGAFHVSSPKLHPRYHYSTFIGGILILKREDFALVNGMSNKYWGWGLEDDEFYVRLKEFNIKINRPENLTTGINNTFKHIHDKNYRKRDMIKCFNQREVTRKRDRETGLNNISYKIEQIFNITIDSATATILNVALNCDKSLTPWCQCNKNSEISSTNK